MKANEINLESILAKINPDDWGMAWEAIHNATTKEIDFATEASAITYCKTFIWATKYNEDILTRKKVVVDEDGNKKTVVIRAKRFISIEAEAEKRAGYEKIKTTTDLIDACECETATPETKYMEKEEESRLAHMLSTMGFSDETIEMLLAGGRKITTKREITRRKVRIADMNGKEEVAALRRLKMYYAN